MPNTPLGRPYPAPTDDPDGAGQIQALALACDGRDFIDGGTVESGSLTIATGAKITLNEPSGATPFVIKATNGSIEFHRPEGTVLFRIMFDGTVKARGPVQASQGNNT